MDKETHDILVTADRLNEWEFPSDSADDLWAEIDALLPMLESLTCRKLDVDRNVQDASFLTDIGLLSDRYYDRKTGTGVIYYIFAFRFSNFGRLFTLHGGEWEERHQEFHLTECTELIKSRGFVYVRAEDLESPYDGINGSDNPIDGSPLTWWIRFFDYI
jgi:hypothetical protein